MVNQCKVPVHCSNYSGQKPIMGVLQAFFFANSYSWNILQHYWGLSNTVKLLSIFLWFLLVSVLLGKDPNTSCPLFSLFTETNKCWFSECSGKLFSAPRAHWSLHYKCSWLGIFGCQIAHTGANISWKKKIVWKWIKIFEPKFIDKTKYLCFRKVTFFLSVTKCL